MYTGKFDPNSHIGERFERLLLLSYNKERSDKYNEEHRGKDIKHYYICKCDCGTIKSINYKDMRRGQTKSCGCYNIERIRNMRHDYSTRHGQYKTRLYNIWSHMKGRCNNPNDDSYKYYSGRGIKVCNKWNEDFVNFYNWAMNNGYRDDLTIDRINNDGNYEPSNCRWTDMVTQLRNNSRNLYISYVHDFRNIGRDVLYTTLVITDWLKILRISYNTFKKYLTYERGDMSVNEIIEYCYALGHGYGSEKIMYFDFGITSKSDSAHLDKSIKDEYPNSNRPQSIRSKELFEELKNKSDLQRKKEVYVEMTFGRLTTIGPVYNYEGRNYVRCRCECGKELSVRYDHLISGNTKSCGCLQKDKTHDILIKRNTTHGDTHTRLYHMWQKLKVRAKKAGVSLYEKWAKSYEEFKEWAEDNEYNDSLFVERIDENHGFYPYNCQLVDYHTLQIKKEGNVYLSLEIDGKMYTFIAKDWESITGIKAGTIKYRIYNLDKTHMSIKEVLTTSIDGSSIDIKVPKEMLKYNLPEKYEVSYHD